MELGLGFFSTGQEKMQTRDIQASETRTGSIRRPSSRRKYLTLSGIRFCGPH